MDEEMNSNDSDFIDDVMSLLEKEGTVRTEQSTNHFGLLIKEPEVIFQDGLSIDDVLHKEVIITVDETNSNLPGTSYHIDFQEADQPINSDCSHVNITNEDASNNNDISLDNASNNTDPDDPDFLLSQNEIASVDPSIALNIQEDDESDPNANNTLKELANNSQDDLCSVEAFNDQKRKRNKRPNSSSWDINIHKKLRMTGQKYLGYKKVKVDGKITVRRSETEHEERKMGPACNSPVCKANKKRKCTEISQEMR
ncbi:uncharacterized protein LOC120351954 [Nilaparvata lugens]|uniref:uncharacterized protein LOC120351954 n=1 Tax=Nilaparvata lugens TaxID=108931 RepID=UPI00193E9A2C|nr:uncharacterized protein LOC120351954 [Nilaparvata lugens]